MRRSQASPKASKVNIFSSWGLRTILFGSILCLPDLPEWQSHLHWAAVMPCSSGTQGLVEWRDRRLRRWGGKEWRGVMLPSQTLVWCFTPWRSLGNPALKAWGLLLPGLFKPMWCLPFETKEVVLMISELPFQVILPLLEEQCTFTAKWLYDLVLEDLTSLTALLHFV